MCVSSYAWSPRLAQQPGSEARSEWSKYELVLWILVNYHGLFAWDNDRPGLAKTASLYVRRKWALPQTLSANRRKHRIADAGAAVMRSLIISLNSQIYAAVAGGLAKWQWWVKSFLYQHLIIIFCHRLSVLLPQQNKCNVGIPQKLHGAEKMITVFCWIKLPAMKRWWGRQGLHNKCYMASDPKYTQILILRLILVTITDILHPEHQS